MAIHKFCKYILLNQAISVYNHVQWLRDFTYIDDIIQGILSILYSPKLTFDIVNLGESHTISTLDLIKLIEKGLGQKAKLQLMDSQQGDVDTTFADISHAQTDYGYDTQFPVEKGINLFIEWFRHHQ